MASSEILGHSGLGEEEEDGQKKGKSKLEEMQRNICSEQREVVK